MREERQRDKEARQLRSAMKIKKQREELEAASAAKAARRRQDLETERAMTKAKKGASRATMRRRVPCHVVAPESRVTPPPQLHHRLQSRSGRH